MLDSILIVEDERDLAELVALHMGDLAREVHICADGAAALAQVQEHPPALVILDLGLPGLDGLEVWWPSRRLPPNCARAASCCVQMRAA